MLNNGQQRGKFRLNRTLNNVFIGKVNKRGDINLNRKIFDRPSSLTINLTNNQPRTVVYIGKFNNKISNRLAIRGKTNRLLKLRAPENTSQYLMDDYMNRTINSDHQQQVFDEMDSYSDLNAALRQI